jgi:acetolactate decarboxylase
MTSRFDALRSSDNFFFALRVDGTFEHIHARAMRRTKEGVPLVQAAAVQPEFEFQNVPGTMVGFWTPEYAKSLNVPGYHLHFISADRAHADMSCSAEENIFACRFSGRANITSCCPKPKIF